MGGPDATFHVGSGRNRKVELRSEKGGEGEKNEDEESQERQ